MTVTITLPTGKKVAAYLCSCGCRIWPPTQEEIDLHNLGHERLGMELENYKVRREWNYGHRKAAG